MAADLVVRSVAEGQLQDRVAAAVAPAGPTSARIQSSPFLLRLLSSGNVSRIRVSAANVTVEGLTFARIAVDLQDVTFDRSRFLSDRTVVLQSLRRGQAQVEITQEQLSQRLGVPLVLEAGRARARVSGQLVTATATVSDNTLRLGVAGQSVPALTIPKLPLVPCVAGAVILPGRIRLTCSVDRLPPELVGRAIGPSGFA